MAVTKSAIILVVILYLSTIEAFDLDCSFENKSTSEVVFESTIYRTNFSDGHFIKCTGKRYTNADTIPQQFFTNNAARLETEHISEIQARGTFNELYFESSFEWLSTLWIGSNNLKVFDLSHYEGYSRLEKVHISNSHEQVTLKLSSSKHLNHLILDDIDEVKIDCSSLKASKLKGLTTSKAYLIGFNFGCLPQEMEKLELLFMEYGNYYDDLASVKNLPNLKILNLEGNRLSYFDLTSLPASLTDLYLGYNDLGYLETFPLKGHRNLEVLNLGNNRLSSLDMTNLPASLIELDLWYNEFEYLETFPLKRLRNLEVLNLSSNNLNSFNFANLPASITDLDLGYNYFQSLETLPLKELRNLNALNLAFDDLNSFNVKHIPASVTDLGLSFNNLGYNFDVASLPRAIKYLNLMYCNLTIDMSLFSKYTQLEHLDLSGNKDVNGSLLSYYYGSSLKTLIFGDDYYHDDGAAVPNIGDESVDYTTDYVVPNTGDNKNVVDVRSKTNDNSTDDDAKVDNDNDCSRNHVFIPLIVVICVQLIVTFL